jgi:hypothetical protein
MFPYNSLNNRITLLHFSTEPLLRIGVRMEMKTASNKHQHSSLYIYYTYRLNYGLSKIQINYLLLVNWVLNKDLLAIS